MITRQNPTSRNERDANAQMAASCPLLKAVGSSERWCCDGRCSQGRQCPVREVRGVPGGGVVRVVIAAVLVAACAAMVFGWAR
jgi:hypothetical protein